MELGTYTDGRPLKYDESDGAFSVGEAPVSSEQVRGYAAAGQIAWANPEFAVWFGRTFPPPTVSTQPPDTSRPTAVTTVYTGYCRECGGRSQLRDDFSCANGHPRSQIRDVKDAVTGAPYQSPAQGSPVLQVAPVGETAQATAPQPTVIPVPVPQTAQSPALAPSQGVDSATGEVAQGQTKTCAKCDYHYAFSFDACPRCASRNKARIAAIFLLVWAGFWSVFSGGIWQWLNMAFFLLAIVMLTVRAFVPDWGLKKFT